MPLRSAAVWRSCRNNHDRQKVENRCGFFLPLLAASQEQPGGLGLPIQACLSNGSLCLDMVACGGGQGDHGPLSNLAHLKGPGVFSFCGKGVSEKATASQTKPCLLPWTNNLARSADGFVCGPNTVAAKLLLANQMCPFDTACSAATWVGWGDGSFSAYEIAPLNWDRGRSGQSEALEGLREQDPPFIIALQLLVFRNRMEWSRL